MRLHAGKKGWNGTDDLLAGRRLTAAKTILFEQHGVSAVGTVAARRSHMQVRSFLVEFFFFFFFLSQPVLPQDMLGQVNQRRQIAC